MTEHELKAFVDSPPTGLEKLAFSYRQAIGKRQQLHSRIQQLQQALNVAQQEYLKAMGYEEGVLDAIRSLEAEISTRRGSENDRRLPGSSPSEVG